MYDGEYGNSAEPRLNIVRMPDVQNDGVEENEEKSNIVRMHSIKLESDELLKNGMVRMHGEQPKKHKVVNKVRMKDMSMEGVGTEQIVTMYDDTVRMYGRKKIMEFEESRSYETLNE